jgi:hypothetical protein
MLILKRASKHRPDGKWSDDNYDALKSFASVAGRLVNDFLTIHRLH